jgi:hypothetical protein
MRHVAMVQRGRQKGDLHQHLGGNDQPEVRMNKPRPVSPECLFIPLRLDDGRNSVIGSFHPPFNPRDAVVSVVSAPSTRPGGDGGAEVSQPLQGGEDQTCPVVFGCIDAFPRPGSAMGDQA